MVWIKEVQMVDSLDEWKSSRSIAGKIFPNFETLDARIASAWNDIIPNSHFKKKVSLEVQKVQKEDPFLRGRQSAFMIYDYFRVTGAHYTVLNYADSFSVTLRDDNVQEFDTRWDEVLQCMSQIPFHDILESLYTLRIRESAHVKDTVWWCSGTSVQIEGAWVGSTQNSIEFVQHGDSSEDIDAQLSKKIEDSGEKKHSSETPIAKLWC